MSEPVNRPDTSGQALRLMIEFDTLLEQLQEKIWKDGRVRKKFSREFLRDVLSCGRDPLEAVGLCTQAVHEPSSDDTYMLVVGLATCAVRHYRPNDKFSNFSK